MTDDAIASLQRAVYDFAAARDWQQFHDPKNLSMAVASEAGELAAVLRWVPNDESDGVASSDPARQELLDELGDLGILLLQLCTRLNADFGAVVRAKLALNEARYPAHTSRGHAERGRS